MDIKTNAYNVRVLQLFHYKAGWLLKSIVIFITFFFFFNETNALQLDESHKTILSKTSSVLNKKFKRTMSFKNRLLVLHPLSDGDVKHTFSVDAPFQSVGVP